MDGVYFVVEFEHDNGTKSANIAFVEFGKEICDTRKMIVCKTKEEACRVAKQKNNEYYIKGILHI